jgi:hypothetical protein
MLSQRSEPHQGGGPQGVAGAKGLPQGKQGQTRGALTCAFAPLAGLEPAPYGLEIRPSPSTWCYLETSPQIRSGPPSNRSRPGWSSNNNRIAREIASPIAMATTSITNHPTRHRLAASTSLRAELAWRQVVDAGGQLLGRSSGIG